MFPWCPVITSSSSSSSSSCSLSYDRSIASFKISSPESAISCFLSWVPVCSCFLTLVALYLLPCSYRLSANVLITWNWWTRTECVCPRTWHVNPTNLSVAMASVSLACGHVMGMMTAETTAMRTNSTAVSVLFGRSYVALDCLHETAVHLCDTVSHCNTSVCVCEAHLIIVSYQCYVMILF
jgi:hypothetical protein